MWLTSYHLGRQQVIIADSEQPAATLSGELGDARTVQWEGVSMGLRTRGWGEERFEEIEGSTVGESSTSPLWTRLTLTRSNI